jgi:uncharacterized integral membrane protein
MTTRDEPLNVSAGEERSIMDWIKLAIGILGGAALILFFLQNRQEVGVNFLWMEWTTGLIWALLAAAILGALSAAAFATIRGRGRTRDVR